MFRIYHPLTLNGYSNFINAVKRQRNLGLPWTKWHRFCFCSGRQVKPTSHMIRNTQGYAALFAVIQACCHDFQTWYYIWFTVVCGTVALMAQHCCVEFSVVYLIMLIKNNILSISSGEMYSVWLSPQALEFRAPFFPHLVPPEIMVWIFVWKYIFEPFIHILQHFVLQLSRSTNFCF